jgi:hypothetical protein
LRLLLLHWVIGRRWRRQFVVSIVVFAICDVVAGSNQHYTVRAVEFVEVLLLQT